MPLKSRCYRAVFVSLWLFRCPLGATAGDKTQPPADTTYSQALSDGLKLQEDTAAAVARGNEKVAAAVVRIRALDSSSGLRMADHDADFAFGASAIGLRLIGLEKRTDALVFFSEAEKALALAVARVPDTDAQGKAMLLQQLAFIRGHFLDQPAQAKKDFDAAIKLQPKDEWLRRARDSFLNEHADLTRTDEATQK